MKTACPHCDQHYEIDDQYEGQVVECRKCNREFVVKKMKITAPASSQPLYESGTCPSTRCPHCQKVFRAVVKNEVRTICPICHKKLIPKRNYDALYGLIIIIAGLVVVGYILFGVGSCYYKLWQDSGKLSDYDISDYAEKTISSRLINPGGAKFQPYHSREIRKIGSDTWRVELWCDASNAFGGTIRKTYLVEIIIRDGRWHGNILAEK